MSTLKEHFQSMPVEELDRLLSDAAYTREVQDLVRTIVNRKLGTQKYEELAIKKGEILWLLRPGNQTTLRTWDHNDISVGLESGWLTLDDAARTVSLAENGTKVFRDWQPLREVAKELFEGKTYLDAPKAFAKRWGPKWGVVVGILGGALAFMVFVGVQFNLDLLGSLSMLLIIALAYPLMAVSRNFVMTGAIVLGGGYLLVQIIHRPMNFWTVAGILIGGYMLLVVAGLVFFGIGWLLGYSLGFIIGGIYSLGFIIGGKFKFRFAVPASRVEVPTDVRDRLELP
jgi:hypothetical protein